MVHQTAETPCLHFRVHYTHTTPSWENQQSSVRALTHHHQCLGTRNRLQGPGGGPKRRPGNGCLPYCYLWFGTGRRPFRIWRIYAPLRRIHPSSKTHHSRYLETQDLRHCTRPFSSIHPSSCGMDYAGTLATGQNNASLVKLQKSTVTPKHL